MKIKVGNKIYSGDNEIIMVILTEKDKRNIEDMPLHNTKYCQYPLDKYSREEIERWMKDV